MGDHHGTTLWGETLIKSFVVIIASLITFMILIIIEKMLIDQKVDINISYRYISIVSTGLSE